MSLSVAIITKNEESNIFDCLETVKWAEEIIIVDSQSTDRTKEIASKFTSKIYDLPFINYADQKNNALDRCSMDWVLFIDADERATPDLVREIKSVISNDARAAFAIHRKTYFLGHRLRFSGTTDDYPVRLFPRTQARFDQPVHEELITSLPVQRLKSSLIHHTTRTLKQYYAKLEKYIALELKVMKNRGDKSNAFKPYFRGLGQFIRIYFIKLGILDGITGLRYAWLSASYTFIKQKRYHEQNKL